MEASLAATGIFDVFATNAVLFMIDSVTPPISTDNFNRNNTNAKTNRNARKQMDNLIYVTGLYLRLIKNQS